MLLNQLGLCLTRALLCFGSRKCQRCLIHVSHRLNHWYPSLRTSCVTLRPRWRRAWSVSEELGSARRTSSSVSARLTSDFELASSPPPSAGLDEALSTRLNGKKAHSSMLSSEGCVCTSSHEHAKLRTLNVGLPRGAEDACVRFARRVCFDASAFASLPLPLRSLTHSLIFSIHTRNSPHAHHASGSTTQACSRRSCS